jgi:hypothetical protein
MNESAQFSPIARAIVLRAISSLQVKNFKIAERHVINTDMVPRMSEKILPHKSLTESPVHAHILAAQVSKPLPTFSDKNTSAPMQVIPQQSSGSYGKIANLVQDINVTHIECFGPHIPVTVIKFGQKQITNIILSEDEIKLFLAFVSEKSKIPLTSGVFKVVVDGMLVNAIVSEEIGTKFMIKKNYKIPQK